MIRLTRYTLLFMLTMLLPLEAHAQRESFVTQVHDRVEEILLRVDSNDQRANQKHMDELMALADTVISRVGVRQAGAMVRAEAALGVFDLLLNARAEDLPGAVAQFLAHPSFMDELGLLVHEQDDARGVLALAVRLMDERSDQVEQYPALAAALCVVHDMQRGQEFTRRINEHNPVSSDPVSIFDYFVRNTRTLTLKPDQLPAVALVYVVDTTETPEQMQWAHDRFRTNPDIKSRFFEIEYDSLHFQQNRPKRVTSEPGEYNIQKINQFGGVCADQTYYAMSVAKACGVPSAYVRARGADVSHAWVGFVEVRGRRAAWNFDAGRYDDYQNLRGNIIDPQTRESVSDGRVGILGNAMSTTNEQVLASLAAARAMVRLNAGVWKPDAEMELETRGNLRTPRSNSVDDRLDMLKSHLAKCAGVPRAWDRVVALASSGEMDERQMDVWSRAVMQLAGRQHQDFAFDFLVDLISTQDEAQRQHEMWEWAFKQFRQRPDLASAVRFEQGVLWSANNNLEYAWLAYNDVVGKFINDGPMAVSALAMMSEMLASQGKPGQIIPVLEDAARSVRQPGGMSTQFARQSNHYQIHAMLAEAYENAGRDADAQRVRTKIGL
jgi:hypothetical protein